MRTIEPDEIHGIQVLRGVAAVTLLVHHAIEMSNGSAGRFSPGWLTTSGAVGVDTFFVISGFIMLRTSFRPTRPPIDPISFLKRRFLRIYPFYWLCLLAMSAVFLMGFMKSHAIGPARVVQSALLLPDDPLINVSWTLSYEVFFYLLFAASLLSAARTTTAILSMAAIAAAILFGILLALFARKAPKAQPANG